MAQKPDGKPARTERVTFTRRAAERISEVVRTVEAGDRDTGPLSFGARAGGGVGGKQFRMATFTGAWTIDTAKTLTFRNVTTTPNTVSVQNVMFPLPQLSSDTSSPTVCAIAKDGTAWFVVNIIHNTHNALSGVSLTSNNLQFSRQNALSISTTAATTGIGVASCNTAQASGMALSYFQ